MAIEVPEATATNKVGNDSCSPIVSAIAVDDGSGEGDGEGDGADDALGEGDGETVESGAD